MGLAVWRGLSHAAAIQLPRWRLRVCIRLDPIGVREAVGVVEDIHRRDSSESSLSNGNGSRPVC